MKATAFGFSVLMVIAGLSLQARADWHGGDHGGDSFDRNAYEHSEDIEDTSEAALLLIPGGSQRWICFLNDFITGTLDGSSDLHNNKPLEMAALYTFSGEPGCGLPIEVRIQGFSIVWGLLKPSFESRKETCVFENKQLVCDGRGDSMQYVRHFTNAHGSVYLYIENTYPAEITAKYGMRKSKSNPDRGVGSVYHCIRSPL